MNTAPPEAPTGADPLTQEADLCEVSPFLCELILCDSNDPTGCSGKRYVGDFIFASTAPLKVNPIYRFSGDTREHRLLHELLPLASPLSILVDPTNLCNFACVFCPTGHSALVQNSGRGTGIMSLDLFRKIADDIAAFGAPLERLVETRKGALVAAWFGSTANASRILNLGVASEIALASCRFASENAG